LLRLRYHRLTGWDLVVVVKAKSDGVEFAMLGAELDRVIDELEAKWDGQSGSF
jgi:RNase P protein component